MQIDHSWSQSWPQAGSAVTPSDQLEPGAQFNHVADFAQNDVGLQMSSTRYSQGTIHRSGSKRLRTNDYPPSSSSLGGFLDSPSASVDQRSAQAVPVESNMFTHGMFQDMPRDATNGFATPPHPVHRSQMGYQTPSNWTGTLPNIHQDYTANIPAGQPDQSTPLSITSYTPANERYAVDHPAADMQTYLPHQPLVTNTSFAMPTTQKFFYGMDESYMTGPNRLMPQNSADGYNKSMEWPDAKWACATFPPNGNPAGMFQDTAELYGKDASQHLKLQSLTILDNLATQIIFTLAKPSLADLAYLTDDSDSDERQAYMTQKDLFDQTRKVYCRDSPFINAFAVQLFTPSQQDIIRKANRATFISSLLEAHDIDFYDLNDCFLETFVPQGQRLLKWQGAIFLELKTQAYIYSLLNNEQNPASLLNELFPFSMEERIIARHPDAPHLVPSEQDFVERVKARKQYLQAEPEVTALQSLPLKYSWLDFMKEFAACIHKNVESLISTPNRSSSAAPSNASGDAIRRGTPSQAPPTTQANDGTKQEGECCNDARAYSSFGALVPERSVVERMFPHALIQSTSAHAAELTEKSPPPAASTPPKTASTTRQPWRQEEEDALLAGLEEVKGPYWSRILSLYGRGGSKSEILKDRTQIQLKDKARNLKLWHLKMGNEVPACLQGVTGELRKRGGAKVRAALGLDAGEDKTESEKGSKKGQQ